MVKKKKKKKCREWKQKCFCLKIMLTSRCWLLTDSNVVDGITAVWHKHFEWLCRVALKQKKINSNPLRNCRLYRLAGRDLDSSNKWSANSNASVVLLTQSTHTNHICSIVRPLNISCWKGDKNKNEMLRFTAAQKIILHFQRYGQIPYCV